MNSQTQRYTLSGPAGLIEALRDEPRSGIPHRGLALIAHPHPIFGGTMENKVVQTLARSLTHCGWTALRFNFRGVGASEGTYDTGKGEVDDLLAVLQHAQHNGPLALAGFSFGGYIALSALEKIRAQHEVQKLVLIGAAASRFALPALAPDMHDRTLVVHGEADDVVPFSAIMDWARPQTLPVTVVPGGGHFFHGQLTLLKNLIVRHLDAAL